MCLGSEIVGVASIWFKSEEKGGKYFSEITCSNGDVIYLGGSMTDAHNVMKKAKNKDKKINDLVNEMLAAGKLVSYEDVFVQGYTSFAVFS